jgi:hypothetical protein
MVAPGSARAEGFLDFLLGGFQRPAPPPDANIHTPPAAGVGRIAPSSLGQESVNGGGTTGHAVVFCVRLCDGQHFPIERMNNGTPGETCRAICPHSKTKVFFGSEIGNAVAQDGQRYAALDTAFAYRKQLVANCTCNGRDALGLASFNLKNDPTLRAGDIVSSKEGLLSYTGKSGQGPAFTPVNPATLPANVRPGPLQLATPPSTEPAVEDEPGTIVPPDKRQPQGTPTTDPQGHTTR